MVMILKEPKLSSESAHSFPNLSFFVTLSFCTLFLSPEGFSPSSSYLLSHSCCINNIPDADSLCSSMADAERYIKPKRLAPKAPPKRENPNKFYTHFMFKAVIVSLFLVLLPLLPTQAPEFVHHTIHTRSWELVQLLFVGIAVSYGLFSRRSEQTEKENCSKFDNAQSLVSRFLQVSSVFDDEADTSSGYDENKVQTWNSQHFREELVAVISQKSSAHGEQINSDTLVGEKPLLLPVRSLKSRVSDSDLTKEASRSSKSLGSNRFTSNSSKPRIEEFGGSVFPDVNKVEKNIALRSPIPWRSRSMERREEMESVPMYCLPPSVEKEESEPTRIEPDKFRHRTSRSSKPNTTPPSPSLSSPKKLSPSPSFSRESRAKDVEEVTRKMYYKTTLPRPPPPPPPPPPPYGWNYSLVRPNSSASEAKTFSGKELKRSVRSVPKDLTQRNFNGEEEMLPRVSSEGESRRRIVGSSAPGKSVRTIRGGDLFGGTQKVRDIEEDVVGTKAERSSKVESKKPAFGDYEEEKPEVVDCGGDSGHEEVACNSDGGADVNKKADEFIAKFREQIRLQRIDSIKRSTGQLARNSPR